MHVLLLLLLLAWPGGGLHSEANISFHPFYKHTFKAFFACCVATATHYKNCNPLPRPGKAPVGALPSLVGGSTVKQRFPSILFTDTCQRLAWPGGGLHSETNICLHPFYKHDVKGRFLPVEVEGAPAPPPSRRLRTHTGALPGSLPVHALSSFLSIPNNCDATPAHTFVGTPRGCGFHPSNVDG